MNRKTSKQHRIMANDKGHTKTIQVATLKQSRVVCFRIPNQTYEAYKSRCAQDRKTMTEAARKAVMEYMEKLPMSKAS